MSSNIINFPERETSSSLFCFDESSDPEHFLAAIEEVFRAQQSLKPLEVRLEKFRALTTEKEVREKVFPRACVLLSKLKFAQPDKRSDDESNHSVVASEKDKEVAEKLANLFNEATKIEEELKERAKITPYHGYPPAYSLADVILLVFAEDDPVKVVCEYMRALCPEESYSHPGDCWFSDKERIPVSGDSQHFFLKEILRPLAPYSVQDGTSSREFFGGAVVMLLDAYFSGLLKEDKDKGVFDLQFSEGELKGDSDARTKKVARSLVDSLDTYEGFLTVFFSAFFDIPQGLFVAVLRHWQDNGPHLKESSTSHHLMEALANHPVGRPPDSWEDVAAGAHDKEWVKRIQTVFSRPSIVPYVPCGMSEGRWFWNLFDAFIPHEYNSKSSNNTYWNTLQAWSNKIAMLRDHELRGRYPWKPESHGCNWYHESNGTRPEWDTHLHIEALLLDDEDSGKWNYESDDFGDDDQCGHRSFKLHQNFWIAADREGFPEFGNAVFAFYLMRKTIFDQNDHSYLNVDWPEFSDLVRKALDRPGHRWVRRAIEFMKSMCVAQSWDLDHLRLRNIVPESAQVVPFSSAEIRDKVEAPRRECEKQIEAEVGVDSWRRFSMRSKELMIDAEMEFKKHAPNLGRGRKEFGGAVLDYARPFECELDIRLKQVYQLPKMGEFFKRSYGGRYPKHPVLGEYLFMLRMSSELKRKEDAMPDELIADIERTGVTSHRHPELLKQLSELKEKRNPAAHGSEKISPGKLADIRHLVFSDGLLRDFLGSLSPTH